MLRRVYFVLFTVSGFAGLIYESIWSHYLKLFLGHAAWAQTVVLIIFMGGLALGSWFAARRATAFRRPILAYAIVEGVIGLLALGFHGTFVALTDAFFLGVLPAVGPDVGVLLKWLLAALLITPQSILLGMTFPLLTGGVLRRFPDAPGASIATLYFTNSLGGALGVLASAFLLVPAIGLPGTIAASGALNVLLALTVWWLVRRDGPQAPAAPVGAVDVPAGQPAADLQRLFLAAAAITGAASFIYEIGWIRMLSLVLGSTTQSFELMLSAFIGGLALGGLIVRRYLDRLRDAIGFSGWVQIAMGGMAVASIAVYSESFTWMTALMLRLPQTDNGYLAYSVASHGIAAAVMLPATILAGMTLPLFTVVLLRKGHGEPAIGRVYAANTVGAIVGVLLAVHVGLPQLGVKGTIGVGAALDIALGLWLLARSEPEPAGRRQRLLLRGAAAVAVIAVAFALFPVDPRKLASGVFRYARAELPFDATVDYYRDGKTASISVLSWTNGSRAIVTNGKPDASLQMQAGGMRASDEQTMVMIGVLPLAYKPDARRLANIGFGSGLTSHTILIDPRLEQLDTIEIEPAMVEGARHFGERVARAYDDPRSKIHFEDAKTFFPLQGVQYDAIIAEPSNPWVSGVASLFSTEFYALAARHLVDDGVLVQWLQFYEFNDELAISVLKALAPHFEDLVIYSANDFDGIIVARKRGAIGEPDLERLYAGPLGQELRTVRLESPTRFMSRQIATRADVLASFDRFAVPANSDYYPYVELHAPAARFKQTTAQMFVQGPALRDFRN